MLLSMRFSLVVIGLEGKGWMSVVAGLIKKDVGCRLVAAGGSAFVIIVIACLLIVWLIWVFPSIWYLFILAWGSEFMGCVLLKPAVWHGLTP